jgi:alkylated DNA repair dioxygenase AlkB
MSVPGLICLPDWIDEALAVELSAAIDSADWDSSLRRRVQHYGHRYDYGRRTVSGDVPAPAMPEWARPVVDRLAAEGRMARPDQLIVNEYLPGQGISAHVDCVPCFGPVVASVSLGSACQMDFIHPGTGLRIPVSLPPRGLCLMTGDARYTWRHAIAARRSDPGPHGRVPRARRVSLTLRTVLPVN